MTEVEVCAMQGLLGTRVPAQVVLQVGEGRVVDGGVVEGGVLADGTAVEARVLVEGGVVVEAVHDCRPRQPDCSSHFRTRPLLPLVVAGNKVFFKYVITLI